MGIQPTTFSLGTDSSHTLTEADNRGKEQASADKPTTSLENTGQSSVCHPDS